MYQLVISKYVRNRGVCFIDKCVKVPALCSRHFFYTCFSSILWIVTNNSYIFVGYKQKRMTQ
ncbi:hypothetical protein EE52_015905 [Bacteroides fragilis]|nr:hypothetical protein EE52_015905 [Bacteroides fragilis]RGN63446.1 hypothetical protein DXB60_09605 [Bacteroides fragilis]